MFFKRTQKNEAFRTEKNAVPNPVQNIQNIYFSSLTKELHYVYLDKQIFQFYTLWLIIGLHEHWYKSSYCTDFVRTYPCSNIEGGETECQLFSVISLNVEIMRTCNCTVQCVHNNI